MSSAESQPSSQCSPENASFTAAEYANDGQHHLLLAASGSVAAIKIPNIVQALSHHANVSIRILFTESAQRFLEGQSAEQPAFESLREAPNVDGIHLDKDEWQKPWIRGDGILHIELRRWAHLLIIAPLSANTMAKVVGGFSDNLLCSVVRAWDTTGEIENTRQKKRIIVAPAMNTAMWRHPITKKQIRVLEEEWGVEVDGWIEVLRPVEKELACGDVGDGAMKDWRAIVSVIEERLSLGAITM
ncbi:MAG: hypothetical protein M1837_003577 [Sclerophora amabilis]|nr:MAG: hypothetical protein M1837_003577 [Sclerophora amabilis]